MNVHDLLLAATAVADTFPAYYAEMDSSDAVRIMRRRSKLRSVPDVLVGLVGLDWAGDQSARLLESVLAADVVRGVSGNLSFFKVPHQLHWKKNDPALVWLEIPQYGNRLFARVGSANVLVVNGSPVSRRTCGEVMRVLAVPGIRQYKLRPQRPADPWKVAGDLFD